MWLLVIVAILMTIIVIRGQWNGVAALSLFDLSKSRRS